MDITATSIPGLQLVRPDPERDAPFALAWFKAPQGKDTLRLMGNAGHEIKTPTLVGETETLKEFIRLEREGKQLTRMIRIDDKTIGAAWIELTENHNVRPPSVHLMVGDPTYRSRGIGKSVMVAMIDYIKLHMDTKYVYSRHLKANAAVSAMNKRVGFVDDGAPYTDENNLVWQNIKLVIR